MIYKGVKRFCENIFIYENKLISSFQMRTDLSLSLYETIYFSFKETKLTAKTRGAVRRKTAEPPDALQISQISSLEGTQISSNSNRFTYIFQIEL
jgi:hypothetical protein